MKATVTPIRGSARVANRNPYWQDDAACRTVNTDTFYLPDSTRGAGKVAREAAAKAICHSCPVMANCLDWALKYAESYGVWGGTTPEERDRLVATARNAS